MDPGSSFMAGVFAGLMLGFASEIIADIVQGYFDDWGGE